MSAVDPELRWWRNARLLRAVAIVLWAIVFLTALVTGWSNALYLAGARWESWAGADGMVGVDGVSPAVVRLAETSTVVVVWPVVVAAFVDGYARHRTGGGEAWCIASAFGWTLLGLGLGSLAAVLTGPVPWMLPALLALLGVLSLAIKPVSDLLRAGRAERQSWSRMHGTPVTAVVTKVDIVTINSIDRWRVTLRYEDATGHARWHRASAPMGGSSLPAVGGRYELRYDPEHPARRSAIFVDLTRPKTPRRR